MRIAATGLLITACSVLAGLGGTDIFHYWQSLILLGLGWNFGFTSASAKIIEYHLPEEKNQVQSLNDFVVVGVMIVGQEPCSISTAGTPSCGGSCSRRSCLFSYC
ncbi:hypothetical protein AF47_04719 [Klebsiella aerogenes MGH 61]|nr:hypothetical protein AF47_04719 [Klebsiella aerogenes MGH 61]